MRRLPQLLIILICLIWTPLFAQSKEEVDFKKAVDTIQAEKRDLVGETMNLTEKEREGFWPLYDEYQEALQKTGGRMLRLIKAYGEEYKSLSDQRAKAMLEEFLSTQRDRLRLKESYVQKFSEILPPRKVMRYFQLENKFEAAIDHELAKNIPLVE